MHSTLKQRLIGAAVLIALAVIFLPMAIHSPGPETGVGDVSLTIPEQPPRAVQTQELALQLPTTAPPPALDPLPDDPDRVVAIDADATERPDALAGHEPVPTSAPSTTPANVAAAVEPTPKVEPELPKPAAPKPAAPKPAPAVNAAAGAYAVNLGTYANLDNASKLLMALKAAGLAATSESVSVAGKPAMRLRLGPYPRQADAQSARITALGVRADLPASVVVLDGSATSAATPTSATATSAKPKVGFAVQVGAFSDKADATALVTRLKNAGFIGFSEPVKTANGTLYRVRVGPEITRAEAERLRTSVAEKLKLDGIVVSHP